MKEVAVAILNFNGLKYLKKFLAGIIQHLPSNAELVIIDNKSSDASLDWLRQEHPELTLICLEENHGFAKGYNKGLFKLGHPYFLLLNSDIEVKEDFFSPLLSLMKSDEQIAAIQPKILSQERPEYFEYAGAAGGLKDFLGYTFCRGRIFDHCEKDDAQYDQTAEIFWASGAAFLIKADLFKKFKGFDADYFAHMEEIDLCWRLKNASYKIMVEPKSRVFHVGGGTLNYGNPRKTFLNFRNNLRTLIKNEKGAKLIWLFPLRLILDGLAALQFLSKGQWRDLLAIFKAHWAVFLGIPGLLKKRKEVKKLRDDFAYAPQARLMDVHQKSIIWQYFIKGINKFSDL